MADNSSSSREKSGKEERKRQLIERMKEGYRKMGPINLELAEEGFISLSEMEE